VPLVVYAFLESFVMLTDHGGLRSEVWGLGSGVGGRSGNQKSCSTGGSGAARVL